MIFTPLIDRFKQGDTAGAVVLANELGLPAKNVRRWVDSDSIPADWFSAVVRVSQRRGFDDVTAEKLSTLAEERRLRRSTTQGQAAA